MRALRARATSARGEPVALLQERFAPALLLASLRDQRASTKTIGGMEYSNAVRGDGQQATRPVTAARQRAALARCSRALQPSRAGDPRHGAHAARAAPVPATTQRPVELFGSRTRPAFDELGAARTLAQMIVDGVLQRERAARLVQFAHARAAPLTLGETIDALVAATWGTGRIDASPKRAALRRVAQRAVADRLLTLAADRERGARSPRAVAEYKIGALRARARHAARGRRRPTMSSAHWSGDRRRLHALDRPPRAARADARARRAAGRSVRDGTVVSCTIRITTLFPHSHAEARPHHAGVRRQPVIRAEHVSGCRIPDALARCALITSPTSAIDMPEAKYSYKPTPEVRTFGQLSATLPAHRRCSARWHRREAAGRGRCREDRDDEGPLVPRSRRPSSTADGPTHRPMPATGMVDVSARSEQAVRADGERDARQ